MSVVLELDDEIKERLRHRAARHGRSLEAELHEILRDAAGPKPGSEGLGTKLTRRFAGIGLKEGEEIREFRGDWGFRTPDFGE
jgi:plasmid stability protein